MTSSVGKQLQKGKYVLQEEVGRGISGITYNALNVATNEEVAIKTLNIAIVKEDYLPELTKKFLEEARRLVRCSHPNIISFRDFFIEDKMPYIVMDRIKGITLASIVMPDNPLDEDVAVNCIRQIGEAVKIVHANGLLHRDIRPDTIMLQEGTQKVVLIDFGIAREFKPGAVQTQTHITSEYSPLEQHLPRARRSQATDVYGLAATLYTLLVAQVPVAAPLRGKIEFSAPRDIRGDLSPEVSLAVMKGMILEQEHRPANVDEWLAMLPRPKSNNFTINIPDRPAPSEPVARNRDPEPVASNSQPANSQSKFNLYLKIGVALVVGFIVFDYIAIRLRSGDENQPAPNNNRSQIELPYVAGI